MGVVVFHVAEAVVILEEAIQAVRDEEINSPNQGISFLLVNFVEGPITQCSSVIRDLILLTWENRSWLILHTRM
jgi:hypothetical protein